MDNKLIDLEEERDNREPCTIDFDEIFRDLGDRYKYTFGFMYPNKPKSFEVVESFTKELIDSAELERIKQKLINQTKKKYMGFTIDELQDGS